MVSTCVSACMNGNVCVNYCKSASEAQSNFGSESECLLTERECFGCLIAARSYQHAKRMEWESMVLKRTRHKYAKMEDMTLFTFLIREFSHRLINL